MRIIRRQPTTPNILLNLLFFASSSSILVSVSLAQTVTTTAAVDCSTYNGCVDCVVDAVCGQRILDYSSTFCIRASRKFEGRTVFGSVRKRRIRVENAASPALLTTLSFARSLSQLSLPKEAKKKRTSIHCKHQHQHYESEHIGVRRSPGWPRHRPQWRKQRGRDGNNSSFIVDDFGLNLLAS